MKQELKNMLDEIYAIDGHQYPGWTMTKVYHRPQFEASRGIYLDALMQIQKADLVMLCEEGIIDREQAHKIRQAILEFDIEKIRNLSYDPAAGEDMFFFVEKELSKLAGNCASNLHLGRSRNDISITTLKMELRQEVLELIGKVNRLQAGLLAFAEEHMHTLMPAYTHTQQAQPITLGHYFSGVIKMLERDLRRLKAAFDNLQECPLGAGAISTSGFALNRETLKELCGFKTIMVNSYDCISASDYITEMASAISVLMLDLGRVVNNLLVWSAEEYGFQYASRAYVGISSMMPQKRNPSGLEDLHTVFSEFYGLCQTCLIMTHNTNYEDVLDHPFSRYVILPMFDRLVPAIDLLHNIIISTEIDREVLRNRAMSSFAVMTEFADMLVREEKIDYRTAHHVASALVDLAQKEKLTLGELTAEHIAKVFEEVTGRVLTANPAHIRQSLDAQYNVDVRTVMGGPAEAPMNDMLEESRKVHMQNVNWYETNVQHIQNALKLLDERMMAL